MPEFHRLHKSKTSEISKEELNKRLRDEVSRSASGKSAPQKKRSTVSQKRDQRLSEQTKRQMPPRSPVRKKRDEEIKKREKLEQKKKKRRRHGSYIVYYILLGILAFIIFAILSVTVLFNSEKIIVEGETIYTDEEIIEASGLTGTENLVRLNLSGVNKRITDALVSLDSAEVSKQFPNAIKIAVKPAEPMANFYYAGKNYVISHVGRVMQIESSAADCMEVIGYQPGDSVKIGDYITAVNPLQDEMVAEISAAIERLEFANITRVDISDTLSIVITYEDRVYIKIGSILSLDEKLSMAKEIIEHHIEPGERVSLDVTSTERVVQRPITVAAQDASPEQERKPESTSSDEEPEPGPENT